MAHLLSPTTLATELDVPVATIYRWNHHGTGPRPIKVGKHVRYRREDVDTWLVERAGDREGTAA